MSHLRFFLREKLMVKSIFGATIVVHSGFGRYPLIGRTIVMMICLLVCIVVYTTLMKVRAGVFLYGALLVVYLQTSVTSAETQF